jgi:hypothetical protein
LAHRNIKCFMKPNINVMKVYDFLLSIHGSVERVSGASFGPWAISWITLKYRCTGIWVVKVKVKVALRLAVYRQSVLRLGIKPLETCDQGIFFQLNLCGNSHCVTSSLTRRLVCLLWICLAFRQVYISHI